MKIINNLAISRPCHKAHSSNRRRVNSNNTLPTVSHSTGNATGNTIGQGFLEVTCVGGGGGAVSSMIYNGNTVAIGGAGGGGGTYATSGNTFAIGGHGTGTWISASMIKYPNPKNIQELMDNLECLIDSYSIYATGVSGTTGPQGAQTRYEMLENLLLMVGAKLEKFKLSLDTPSDK